MFYALMNRYPSDLEFVINGKPMEKFNLEEEYSLSAFSFTPLKDGKHKIGIAVFGVSEKDFPLGSDNVGIALCVLGKVVKYELFNFQLGDITSKIFGIVEVPPLIEFLTTNKSDFIKKYGKGGNKFRSYINIITTAFKEWCAKHNIRDFQIERTRDTVKLEIELARLISEIPEISSLFSYGKGSALYENRQGSILAKEVEGALPTLPIGEEGRSQNETNLFEPGPGEGKSLIEDNE
jgi:hypothetical protein